MTIQETDETIEQVYQSLFKSITNVIASDAKSTTKVIQIEKLISRSYGKVERIATDQEDFQ